MTIQGRERSVELPNRPGELECVGYRDANYKVGRWPQRKMLPRMACVDCGTEYHTNALGTTRCNGVRITICPWCREDSQPGRRGRGA